MKDFSPKTFAEFIAYAKANPGKVRFSSVGVGSFPQYDMEILARRAGLDLVHLPNKAGASGMLNDLVSGDAHLGFINAATPAAMVRAGQLRPLAVITEKRMPDYPDVPTLAELGYPGIGTVQWLAIFAPSGVAPSVLDTIHKAATGAVASAAVQEKFKAQSLRAVPTASPEDARRFIQSEFALWRKITTEVKLDLPE
jgi:tripartite-type tricarboxylate transporter receptor subunit TctC